MTDSPYLWIYNTMVFEVIPIAIFVALISITFIVTALGVCKFGEYIYKKWDGKEHD